METERLVRYTPSFGNLLGAFFLALLSIGVIVLLFSLVVRERMRVVSGVCANYDSLVDIIHEPDVMAQLPRGAHQISYWYMPHGGLYEFTIPMQLDDFLAWAESLGWTHDQVNGAKRKEMSLLRYSIQDVDGSPTLMQIDFGYDLQRERTEGRPKSLQIDYDIAACQAYVQLYRW